MASDWPSSKGLGRDAEGKQVASAIVLLDRSGRKTTLSSGWGDLTSLAWSPAGDEVWFTANRLEDRDEFGPASRVHGRKRTRDPSFCIANSVDTRRLLQRPCVALAAPSPDGMLVPRRRVTLNREISGGSMVRRLKHSRRMDERCSWAKCCEAEAQQRSIYLRGTDGSDAVRLGDGFPEDLSPDGKWVLAAPIGNRTHWFILPTGTGSPRTLPPGPLVERFEANFLPDGRRIVFGGREKDHDPRIFVQDVESGLVRAISPENSGTVGVATPDGRFVIGGTAAKRFLYPVDGGAPVPLPLMAPDDTALQWSSDGRLLYVRRDGSWPPVVDRVDVSTGRREAWKTIQPADPVGVDIISQDPRHA